MSSLSSSRRSPSRSSTSRSIGAVAAGLATLLLSSLAAVTASAQEQLPTLAGADKSSGAAQVVFWILSVLVVGGALVTITRKNAISAVMALVATFFGLAALYAMLSAEFIAVIQVLVYAGAIMVLFVFVVMVLNREEAEPWALRGIVTKGLGGACAAYLFVRTGSFLFTSVASRPEPTSPGWGGVSDVGAQLFTRYVFAFEAISLPLLIAVIGAVVVARTPKRVAHEHEGGLASGAPFVEQPTEEQVDDHAPVLLAAAGGHKTPSGSH